MLTPDYKTFLQLSRDATLIPVAKTLSADLLTPVGAFLSIADKAEICVLCWNRSRAAKDWALHVLGAQPATVITARGRDLTIRAGLPD